MKLSILLAAHTALFASSICSVAPAGAEDASGGGGPAVSAEAKETKGKAAVAPEQGAQPTEAPSQDPEVKADATPAEAPSLADPASLGMARMQHPDGATGCSVAGQSYEANAKGIVTVPLQAVQELTSHGFMLVH